MITVCMVWVAGFAILKTQLDLVCGRRYEMCLYLTIITNHMLPIVSNVGIIPILDAALEILN
jgi:hypothetical protein